MTKEFKTIDELVKLLESRGVTTDKSTRAALERESYYAIVNGYKNPFLDKEAMKELSDDAFIDGMRFEWMHSLFLFDRELRVLTFKYLTRAEAVMRTAVSYAFCEAHRAQDAYLDRNNFCKPDEYLLPKKFKGNRSNLYNKNLNELMRILNSKLAVNRRSRDFVKHYVNAYGKVPLWVLANDLTFGNIVHFYQLMQEKDRRRVCSIVARVSNRPKESGFLSEYILLRSATILKDFRNCCAHDERLYCAKSGADAGFSTMLSVLMNLLPKEEADQFLQDVINLYVEYEHDIRVVDFSSLFTEMGFRVSKKEGE